MIILFKHISLLIGYSVLCWHIIHGKTQTDMSIYVGTASVYYFLLLYPKLHQVYIYNIVERVIPKTSYLIRAVFHYCLFKDDLIRAFPSVITLIVIVLLKDIMFLIKHAETRLAKIEEILYEGGYSKRIVHLHSNVYTDDQLTRFHKHCFDTNRLYLDTITPVAEDTSLAIHNYRQIRKDNKSPRGFNEENDRLFYEASSNKYIFISQRWSFIVLPICTIIWCICMTDLTLGYRMYVNSILFVIDLCTLVIGTPKTLNDLSIGISYFMATVFVVVFS